MRLRRAGPELLCSGPDVCSAGSGPKLLRSGPELLRSGTFLLCPGSVVRRSWTWWNGAPAAAGTSGRSGPAAGRARSAEAEGLS